MEYPDLHEIVRRFASPPICNAGTLCGNVANGSPIGDSMPALIALGATVVLRRGDATRTLPLEDFYLDYRRTALAPGEFVAAVRVPRRADSLAFRSYKVSKRYDQDISGVCAAFAVDLADGHIGRARVCFGAMAAVPKRAARCEAALNGARWSAATIEKAAQALAADYQPISDLRASRRVSLARRRQPASALPCGRVGRRGRHQRLELRGSRADVSERSETLGVVGSAERHESAHLHVSGEALYTDDIAVPRDTLCAAVGTSEKAHARIRGLDLAPVRAAPGVVAVLDRGGHPGRQQPRPRRPRRPDLRVGSRRIRGAVDVRGRRDVDRGGAQGGSARPR